MTGKILSGLLYMAVALVFGLIQTVIWFDLTGWTPAPMLWLYPIIYVFLYKPTGTALFLSLLMTLTFSAFTIEPTHLLFAVVLVIFSVSQTVKNRIFFEGSTYFVFSMFAYGFLFNISEPLVSFLLENIKVYDLQILERIISTVLTGFFAFPTYFILQKLDFIKGSDNSQQVGALSL